MTKLTPLHDIHVALGARLTDFAGWSMPLRYGSDVAEHHAVRTTAGLFDLSHMGEIEVAGPQSGAFLDYALVGRPSKIGIGRARYSMLCDASGGIIDDLVVYRLSEQEYFVVANAGNIEVVVESLRTRALGYDTSVVDASEEWALIAVQGPTSAAVIADVGDADVPALRYYAIDSATVAGKNVLLARTGYTGEDGFEIYCAPHEAAEVWQILTAAGEPHGLVPAGLASRDSLRLEVGMPLHGHELSVDINPFEARLGRVVVFDKPDGFVGEKALAEIRDEPPVRRLVGLVTADRRVPRAGCSVLRPGGEPAGFVTSGMPSPTLGHPIAMAFVTADLTEPGTHLKIDVRGTSVGAHVVELPFYSRPV